MKSLLIHQHAYDRIADPLEAFRREVDVVTMDLAGVFRDPRSGAAVATPQPHIGFGNHDVWSNPKARKFIAALVESPHLDWFQSSAAGTEFPALIEIGRNAKCYTTCHVQSEAMAEWAVWMALDFLRAGPERRAQQAAATWSRLDSREIAGSRWLIIGFGSIGAAIGRRVMALGGHVTGVRRSGGSSPDAAVIDSSVTPAALAAADVVVLCTPHTPETEGMANRAFFAGMKQDAALLNLGRGALVDEDDLLAALDAGRPSFAALDVARQEPLPKEHRFWSHPRIALTPHDSGQTKGTVIRTDALFLENLALFLAGKSLRHAAPRELFDLPEASSP
jgi:phosphoglycerate dehydrogenase-like enzyme